MLRFNFQFIALVTVLGAAAGVAGGLFFSRFLRTLLFEVEPMDVWSLALPVGALLVVTLAAAFFPARRAARVDPMVACDTNRQGSGFRIQRSGNCGLRIIADRGFRIDCGLGALQFPSP